MASKDRQGRRQSLRARLALTLLVTASAGLVVAVGAQASTVVDNDTPFSMTITNPCRPADSFLATGMLHTKTTFGQSSGGTTLFSVESNLANVKGVTPLGVRYVVMDSTTSHIVVDEDAMPMNTNLVIKTHWTRQGDDGLPILGDDFYTYIQIGLTINANGTMTADRLSPTSDPCR